MFLVSRNEDTDLFFSEGILVNRDKIEEVLLPSWIAVENIATMGDAWKRISCKPATGVARCVREAEVVVSRT